MQRLSISLGKKDDKKLRVSPRLKKKTSPRSPLRSRKKKERKSEIDAELLKALSKKSVDGLRKWLFQKKKPDLLKLYDVGADKISVLGICIRENFPAGISTVISENNMTREALCAKMGGKIYQETQLTGFSPLGYAIEMKSLRLAKLLISKGCKVNKQFGMDQLESEVGFADFGMVTPAGVSPLGYAVELGDYEMTQLLVEKGAHLESKFSAKLERETPLEFAVSIHRFRIADFLIQKGAKTSAITSVDLSSDDITAVPRCFGHLKHVKHLKLNAKLLETIPAAIRKKGEREIIGYLRDLLSDGQVTWNKAKVMVLGKEGVGKTHLSRRLKGKSYAKNQSTDGIDVSTFKLGGMELTWYDFGGQEVFYPTHSFFLTPQCLYLVVFDLSDEGFKKRVMYWLRTVANYTQDPSRPAKILVVGTHADMVDEARIDFVWDSLNDFFVTAGNVVGYVAVSCSKGTGFDNLERGIEKAIELGRLGKMRVPKAYASIELWISDSRKRLKVPFDEVLAVFSSLHERTVRQALEFLHDMGVCLFFESLNLLITDPQWLADTFSTLITFSHNWIKDGVVAEKDLGHVWKTASPDEILQTMHLLKAFEVAFPKKESGLWVIPSMLKQFRDTEPLELGSPEFAARFRRQYRLEILPLGLFGRLMARLQEWNVETVETWLTGIMLKSKDQVAEIIVEFRDDYQSITISSAAVSKPESERYLIQRLAEECNSLFEAAFPARNGLERPVRQFIACRHCLDNRSKTPTYLTVEECIDKIVNKSDTIQCGAYKVPIDLIGDDLTFGYVRRFTDEEAVVADKPFASGGFGNIFLCKLGAKRAVVKELKTENLTQGFAEFQHETSIMSRLIHPNIVELYGVMLSPLRMVLEFCGHGDLFEAIEKKKMASEALQLKVALDIARGMHFLHSQTPPLAHRDLRSPNILLASLDPKAPVCAKVSDFGLTVAMTETVRDPLNAWQWMSPEAQMGAEYTEKCDLYSYAIVLWEVFSQSFPFAEFIKLNQMELFRKLREDSLRPTIPKGTPKYVTSLIRRMWSGDPDKRPTFAAAISTLENKKIAKAEIKLDDSFSAKPKMPLSRISRKVCADEKFGGPMTFVVCNELLWAGFRHGDVTCFDINEACLVHKSLRVHSGAVRSLARVPLSTSIWSGGEDTKINLFDVEAQDEHNPTAERKLKSPFAVVAQHGGEVLAICPFDRYLAVGDSTGCISIYKDDGKLLAKHQMPLKDQQPVTCITTTAFENVVWFGCGCDLYRATLGNNGSLHVQPILEKAHERFINFLLFVGGEVWSAHGGGNYVKVWNSKTGALMYILPLPLKTQRVHAFTLVNLRGDPTVWVGSDDCVVIFDCLRHMPLQTVSTLEEGDALCLAQVGLNCAWVGVRTKESGFIQEINLN